MLQPKAHAMVLQWIQNMFHQETVKEEGEEGEEGGEEGEARKRKQMLSQNWMQMAIQLYQKNQNVFGMQLKSKKDIW